MRPLQFHQRKADYDWLYLLVSPNTSQLTYDLQNIRSGKCKQIADRFGFYKLNGGKAKRKIATLLTEYYSILFKPEYRNRFRPMTDLSLLFPTKEPIYISNATNFILLPLPLPTYVQHTQGRFNDRKFRAKNPCPFIKHTQKNHDDKLLQLLPDEVVRDMDYKQDNPYVMSPRDIDQSNIDEGYVHTNPEVKAGWIKDTLDKTARIWVYKYDDIHPEEAKLIPTYPAYSMGQRVKQPKLPNLDQLKNLVDNTNPNLTTAQRKNQARGKYDMMRYNEYVHRQYTFLEITPNYTREDKDTPAIIKHMEQQYKSRRSQNLQSYSSKYLEPTQLSVQFAECFDFETPNKESIIQYFMKNAYCNEYTARQIQGGIDRLKNIIKYKKPKKVKQSSIIVIPKGEDVTPKFNQHVRSLNIKQADGNFQSQMIEDFNITKRTSLEDTKPLSSNQQQSGTQLLSQQ